jgi:8-oxo-dGTP diphosphatase
MIYKKEPKNFNPRFEVVSCFVEHDGDILLLHRQDHKPEGNTWGVPAGKIDKEEQLLNAMVREMREETGLDMAPESFSYFDKVFVRFPEYEFIYHMFHTKLAQKPQITISSGEHKDFLWISPKKALDMNLMRDLDACITLFYKR